VIRTASSTQMPRRIQHSKEEDQRLLASECSKQPSQPRCCVIGPSAVLCIAFIVLTGVASLAVFLTQRQHIDAFFNRNQVVSKQGPLQRSRCTTGGYDAFVMSPTCAFTSQVEPAMRFDSLICTPTLDEAVVVLQRCSQLPVALDYRAFLHHTPLSLWNNRTVVGECEHEQQRVRVHIEHSSVEYALSDGSWILQGDVEPYSVAPLLNVHQPCTLLFSGEL